MRLVRWWMLLGLAGLLASRGLVAQQHGHDATVQHRFDDVDRWVKEFESPDRWNWQKPNLVIRILTVEEGQTVADLGAGTGYLTQYLSSAVGPTGRVYAVDVEPAMVDHLRQRPGLGSNVIPVLAEPDDPKLPAGELDLILVVNTWHHIDNRVNYLARLRKTLSREGRVAVIDWHEGTLPLGPPAGSKLSRDSVVAEFEKAGWRLVTESVALPYQYFLVFLPPR